MKKKTSKIEKYLQIEIFFYVIISITSISLLTGIVTGIDISPQICIDPDLKEIWHK